MLTKTIFTIRWYTYKAQKLMYLYRSLYLATFFKRVVDKLNVLIKAACARSCETDSKSRLALHQLHIASLEFELH